LNRTAATSTIEQRDASRQGAPAGKWRRPWWHLCWLTAIFAVALVLRLWFNFAAAHPNCAVSCDASEYLRNAVALHRLAELPSGFWQQGIACLTGQAGNEIEQQVRQRLGFLAEMHQSGPVFPLFLLIGYSFAGTGADPGDWLPPVVAQCLISALTCVLIALIGCYAWDRGTGYLAGLLAAVYPAFIINSGRLYSETFSAFLLCALAWLVLRGFSRPGNGYPMLFLAGVTAASLELTRSVMFLLCLALLPVFYMQNRDRRPLSAMAVLLLGFSTVLVPWWAVEKLAFGRTSLIVDRVGHYNFSVGNNIDTQGWLSYPYPDLAGVEQKSYPALARQSIAKSPERWLKLMLDKPVRLFKLPWNDFRLNIGPFGPGLQAGFHQLLLLLAAAGVALGLGTGVGTPPDARQLRCRIVILGILGLHLIYLLFITVPRYNLTAMPLVILLGAAGASSLALLLKQRPGRVPAALAAAAGLVLFTAARADLIPLLASTPLLKTAGGWLAVSVLVKGLCVAAFLVSLWRLLPYLRGRLKTARAAVLMLGPLLLLTVCLPARAHGRWYEWRRQLTRAGEQITQSIPIPPEAMASVRAGHGYLLLDADGAPEGLEVCINGQPLSGPLIPSLSLVPELKTVLPGAGGILLRECEYVFDCLTSAAGISNRDLRQWFLVPVPPGLNQRQLTVSVTQKNGPATTLFGAYNLGDGRLNVPATTLYSWEKAFYGVENDRGFTDTRYDTKPVRGTPVVPGEEARDLSPDPGRQTGAYNVRLLVSGLPARDHFQSAVLPPPPRTLLSELHSTAGLDEHGDHGGRLVLRSVPRYTASDWWLVTVSGQIRAGRQNDEAGIDLLAYFQQDRGGAPARYRSPWTPRVLSAGPEWKPFAFTVALAPGSFPGALQRLELAVHPARARSRIGAQSTSAAGSLQARDLSVTIVSLPYNPLYAPHTIY
jgi:hypothetical protein